MPLYFLGILGNYPGQQHAKIMANGLFAGFIFACLGVTLPRLLRAEPFNSGLSLALIAAHLLATAALAMGYLPVGDILFAFLLISFCGLVISRLNHWKRLPPSAFVMVGLGFVCAATGSLLAIIQHRMDLDPRFISFQRLASYQGFVLLPLLGVSPIILPRLFGLHESQGHLDSAKTSIAWMKKAIPAGFCGLLIISSFLVEVHGYVVQAYLIRSSVSIFYFIVELRIPKLRNLQNSTELAILAALASAMAGLIMIVGAPAYRIALLHLTFFGGFALILLFTAIQVIARQGERVRKPKANMRWLAVSFLMMFAGLATRISGDFWPKIMPTHYSYGSIMWIVGLGVWVWKMIPSVLGNNSDQE